MSLLSSMRRRKWWKIWHPEGVKAVVVIVGFLFDQKSISPKVYFTENSGHQSLKNRSCATVFDSCNATLTVGEPLGDVSGSANHNFRTSVTGISGEINASFLFLTIK